MSLVVFRFFEFFLLNTQHYAKCIESSFKTRFFFAMVLDTIFSPYQSIKSLEQTVVLDTIFEPLAIASLQKSLEQTNGSRYNYYSITRLNSAIHNSVQLSMFLSKLSTRKSNAL